MGEASQLIPYLEHFSYIGVFSSLIFSGYFIPIPEEVILMAAGYIASAKIANLYLAGLISFLAVLLGDCFLFIMARRGSEYTRLLQEKIKHPKLKFIREALISQKHIGRTIFFLRFFVGLRFIGPVLAGVIKTTWKTFLLFDILALIIYVPAFIFVGYHFNNSFLIIVTKIEFLRHILITIMLIMIGFAILRLAAKILTFISPLVPASIKSVKNILNHRNDKA